MISETIKLALLAGVVPTAYGLIVGAPQKSPSRTRAMTTWLSFSNMGLAATVSLMSSPARIRKSDPFREEFIA